MASDIRPTKRQKNIIDIINWAIEGHFPGGEDCQDINDSCSRAAKLVKTKKDAQFILNFMEEEKIESDAHIGIILRKCKRMVK